MLGFSALCVWLALQSMQPFDFLDELILAIAIGLFALYGWYTVLFEVNSWEVDVDTIRVRDLAGLRTRRFQQAEIISWEEQLKSNKYSHWKALHVQTGQGKFRLLSSGVHNYEDLKHAILKGAPPNQAASENSRPGLAVGMYAAIGLILLGAGSAWALYDIQTPDPPPLTACFDAVLSAAPVHETGSKNSAWMHFPIHQYPELEFTIEDNDGSYQSAAVNELRSNFHQGDTLILCMDTSDYNLYIAKTRGPGFWDRATGYRSIRVLGIQTADRIYLDPANIHAWNQGEPGPWILPMLFGALFLILAIVFHHRSKAV